MNGDNVFTQACLDTFCVIFYDQQKTRFPDKKMRHKQFDQCDEKWDSDVMIRNKMLHMDYNHFSKTVNSVNVFTLTAGSYRWW